MRSRGSSSLLAMIAILVLGAVATIGLAGRSSDLAFERRALGRVCARWAAEAGVAEARGVLAAGQRPVGFHGSLPPATGQTRAGFTVRGSAEVGAYVVQSEGACTASDGHVTRAVITVRFAVREGRWAVASWHEGP